MFGSSDPDNPMGGLLGDLLKVIGSGPGRGQLVRGRPHPGLRALRPTAGRTRTPIRWCASPSRSWPESPSSTWPTPRGSLSSSGTGGVAFEAVGPGQWCFRVLEAYQPVLKSMVEAQQQGAAAVPSSLDLNELDPAAAGGLGGLLGQFAAHAWSGLPRHAVRFGGRASGPPGLRAVRAAAALARIGDPPPRARATWLASPTTGASPCKRCSCGSASAS